MLTLGVLLNVTQRIGLIDAIFNKSLTYNDSYTLSTIQLYMTPTSTVLSKKKTIKFLKKIIFSILLFFLLGSFSAAIPACEECYYAGSGACNSDETGCNCFTNYTGYFCREYSPETSNVSNALEANWTVIVAVVSAVAGLLLIISFAMCAFFCITKRRPSSSTNKPTVTRQQFTIPRAHIPTMGTVSRGLNAWDGFSLDNTYDEQYVDASDSLPSSSTTTYNTTYRTNGHRPEADFGIFDELENRIPISRGQIPRPQMVDMLGTLNSLPTLEQFDDPSGSTFSDTRELDEIELVTDMLDDMTRHDEAEDEFVEALNPNLAIPRLNSQPDIESSGWFSVRKNFFLIKIFLFSYFSSFEILS